MTTTEDRNSELLAIADQAERNYGVLSFESIDTVRSIAEAAGGDWPVRWEGAIRAMQNWEPGALDSFVRLSRRFEERETPEAFRERIFQIVRADVLAEYGLPPDWSPVSLPAECAPSPGSPVDGTEAQGERTTTGYPEYADVYLRADGEPQAECDTTGIRTRSLEIRAKSIDVEARTVRATLVTEEPVPVWDAVRYEMVPEILRADGAILPTQVPLLDSHNRASMSDQLGSVREIVQDGDAIAGTLRFADTDEANHVFGLARDGHTDSVSAGYSVLTQVYVAAGRSSVVRGKSYDGPVNVVTKWKLREVSFAPITLDESAKLRAAAD